MTDDAYGNRAERRDGRAEEAESATFRVALVQLRSARTVAPSVAAAIEGIREAAAGGAHYVLTPETTNAMELRRTKLLEMIAPEESCPALARFRALAEELGIWLHIGSLTVKLGTDRIANRSLLIAPDGRLAARYDKIHMFDVDLPGGESYRESKTFVAGDRAVIADLPWGRLGMTICYDLRFPQLYRALAKGGAHFISVPAAFTRQTGEAHWHVLLRARAIENGCFIFAAAQGGHHETGRETYGHSLIVDPWGEVIAEAAGQEPTVIFADIDPRRVAEVRRRIPSLSHDRDFAAPGGGAREAVSEGASLSGGASQ